MVKPCSILITGASSGIGEALAFFYADDGVFLALTGRNAERLEDVAERCRAKGAVVETSLIDVRQKEDLFHWIELIDDRHPLDLVVANAGISGGTGGVMNGEPMDQAREIFDVNLTGVLNTIDPVLPRMLQRKRGQIAMMSSLAAFRGWAGAPAYSASKGAVRFYGEALRVSLKDTGVKINVICPGFVESRITAANDFRMPFFMKANKASKIIANGLASNRARIAFPLPTHFFAWLAGTLPVSLCDAIMSCLPAKASR